MTALWPRPRRRDLTQPDIYAVMASHRRRMSGDSLTTRQLGALRAYAAQGSVKDAATSLGLTESTVKNLLSESYTRLGVRNATQAYVVLGWLRC